MADPVEAGATGRKPRGANAETARSSTAAAPNPNPPTPEAAASRIDTSQAPEASPSATVAPAGTAALVAEPAKAPVVIGAAEVPVEAGGPGVGALRTAEETQAFDTRSLEHLDQRPLTARERAELELLRRGAGIDPGIVVDAAAVPGARFAVAATTVKRDGVTYRPGRRVPLDYEGYVELVAIGAITDTPWRELEPVEGD